MKIYSFLSLTVLLLFLFPATLHAAEDTLPDTTTYYVASSGGLNVRSGPGTDYAILGSLPHGKEIHVLGTSDGWYEISYHDATGYVSAKYVSSEPVSTTPLHPEEVQDTDETASPETNAVQRFSQLFGNTTLTVLFIAILITIAAIIVTVFSFFHHGPLDDYDHNDNA